MAEFQEVMRQWKRRCEYCDKDENVKCGINGYVCNSFYRKRNYINPEFIERDVMQWAAEHPEPVYPTWWEWLYNINAVAHKLKPDVAEKLIDTGLLEPIPADIAQKLGIEPKK